MEAILEFIFRLRLKEMIVLDLSVSPSSSPNLDESLNMNFNDDLLSSVKRVKRNNKASDIKLAKSIDKTITPVLFESQAKWIKYISKEVRKYNLQLSN